MKSAIAYKLDDGSYKISYCENQEVNAKDEQEVYDFFEKKRLRVVAVSKEGERISAIKD